MIVVDTNALLWRAISPGRLSHRAASSLRREQQQVVPSVCFWEIAMLTTRNRFRLPVPFDEFTEALIDDPRTQIQDITPAIALQSAQLSLARPMDPADQLIAATAMALGVPLVTADERLHRIPGLRVVW